MTHTVTKGPYPVDSYQLHRDSLYMARPLLGHPRIAYMHALLIPKLGVQVNCFIYHAPDAYDQYDYYIDIMSFAVSKQNWISRDYYLDIIVSNDKAAWVIDTEEYLHAVEGNLLTTDEAQYALNKTHETLNGLAENYYDLFAWLNSQGVDPSCLPQS